VQLAATDHYDAAVVLLGMLVAEIMLVPVLALIWGANLVGFWPGGAAARRSAGGRG